MPRNIFKKFMPDYKKIRDHKQLKIFGTRLNNPGLWVPSRSSISKGFAIGLFWAFIPMPFQMVAAASTALLFKGNMTTSVVLVWLTNPFTMPVIFYGEYLLGNVFIQQTGVTFELTMDWFNSNWILISQSLYLGAIISAITASLLGYLFIQRLWIYKIRKKRSLEV